MTKSVFIRAQLFVCFILTALTCTKGAYANDIESPEFSGFARIVGGYLNDDSNTYNGYENNLSFTEESLLGLRANIPLNQSISLVGQAVLRTSDQRDSEIQWLYADYRPSNNLSFKLGRQRIPLFQYSEVIDVGFAYPWISLPVEVYNPFIFTDYDGLLASYEFSQSSFSGSIDAYYGIYDDEIEFGANEFDAKVSDLMGLVGQVFVNQFSFRASYHRGSTEVVVDELTEFKNTLAFLGFVESANALEINNEVKYWQISAAWENLDYFARVELARFDSDAYFVAKTDSYYATIGYNFYPFTLHATIAETSADYGSAPNEIPIGINPQLDFLAQQYALALQAIPISDIQSTTLGLRYDLSASVALKADVSFIRGTNQAQNTALSVRPFTVSEDTELFQLALEWVF